MEIQVHVINAFDHQGAGGNPAGVVQDADRLSAAQRQLIAAGAGLSETAFVSRASAADFRLEFFTPTRQIAHCGTPLSLLSATCGRSTVLHPGLGGHHHFM